MPTFSVSPSFNPMSTRKPRALAVKFGDGYEQRSADGINTDLQSWQLTFANLSIADADTIETFFVTNTTSITPFTWTPPNYATPSKYLCRTWTRNEINTTHATIAATFEEVADA